MPLFQLSTKIKNLQPITGSCWPRASNFQSESKKSMLTLNSLPNNKILDWSKLKAFADDKINVYLSVNNFMCTKLPQFPSELFETCHNETSIFFLFPQYFLYHFQNIFFFSHFYFVVCKYFQFGPV